MNKIFSVLALFCLLAHNRPSARTATRFNTAPNHQRAAMSGPAPAAPTIAFFLDNWSPKQFVAPTTQPATAPATDRHTPLLTIDPDSTITRIPPNEFGHNVNTWMGPMTFQPVFMNHLRNLQPHVLRWPAGSGSDAYFWNAGPTTLPADLPAQIVN